MATNYTDLKPTQTIGGPKQKIDEHNYLIQQSHHFIANNDFYIVSMLLNRIPRVLTERGEFLGDIGSMGFYEGEFNMAAGMTFHNDDEILITDVNESKVLVFEKNNFNFVKEADNEFESPNAIVSVDDRIYVTEVGEDKRLRVFDHDFKEKCVISRAGKMMLSGAEYISHDAFNNRILLTDHDANQVHIFSLNGDFLLSISEKLCYPNGTSSDRHGNILVCNSTEGVKVFDKDGRYISNFGSSSSFTYPMDVFMKENEEIVVLDGDIHSGWSRLQTFKY